MQGAELYVGLFSIFFSPSFEQVHYRSSNHLEKHSHLKIAISTILLTFVSFLLKYYPIMRSIWWLIYLSAVRHPLQFHPFDRFLSLWTILRSYKFYTCLNIFLSAFWKFQTSCLYRGGRWTLRFILPKTTVWWQLFEEREFFQYWILWWNLVSKLKLNQCRKTLLVIWVDGFISWW